MQNSSAWETEDGQEQRSNNIGNHSNKECWDERLIDIWMSLFDEKNSQISSSTHDGTLSEEHHNESNGTSWSESTSMSDNQVEWLPGWSAERGVVDSSLDKGILWNEFDVLVKQVEYSSDAAGNGFENWVFFGSSLLILCNNVFENNSDHCNDSNTEWSKCNSSTVIPQSPSNGFAKTYWSWSIRIFTLSAEVPLANHAGNDHLLLANKEREDPEKTKQEVPEHISSFFFPYDVC